MSSVSRSIPADLVQAYREASYVVSVSGKEIILKVDQANHELFQLMKDGAVKGAAFLTAYNPYSAELALEENELRHGRLIADVDSLGLAFLPGEGRDDLARWHGERSILILGVELGAAKRLADKYEQNAFVWIEGDTGRVNLHLCHPTSGEEGQNGY